MKIDLHYNDYVKNIEIDIMSKGGNIQEHVLNICSLMIYNIEFTEIIIGDTSFIIGDEDFLFEMILDELLNKHNLKEEDVKKIIIHDRRRDENGNVIKENKIIDKYNIWYANYENENYLSYINENQIYDYSYNNSNNIIRYPMDDILNNILYPSNATNENIPLNNNMNVIRFPLVDLVNNIFRNTSNLNTNNEEANNEEADNGETCNEKINNEEANNEEADNEEANNEEADNEEIENQYRYSNFNNFNNEYINLFENRLGNTSSNISENATYSFQTTETTPYSINPFFMPINFSVRMHQLNSNIETNEDNPNIIPNNRFDNIINMFDNYLRTMEEMYDIPGLVDLNEDVKIVLNDEQFNNLERVEYSTIDKENNECLICIDAFNEDDEIIKTHCNHLFHCNCIKSWLCHESNKCPVCRIEIDKGTPSI